MLALLSVSALAVLSGCAKPPPASDPDALADYKANNDPFEPTNRVFYAVNDGLLTYVLTPVAHGYNYAVPKPVRTGIHNVLNNLGSPVQFLNDVLETKPRRAGDTFVRFVLNSTVGVGGVFDVAKHVGYPDHSADAATTLALWGIPAGPYLYLPVFGPSSVRDGIGRGVDSGLNPYTWVAFNGVNTLQTTSGILGAVDAVAPHVDDIKKLNDEALDPYATQRSLYRQLQHNNVEAVRNDRRATIPDWYPGANDQVPQHPPQDTGNTGHTTITPLPLSPAIVPGRPVPDAALPATTHH
ncbi:MlaA family lipoprotein [Rhizosaccharibacter radicis]|uniref:VacJ family lipoprotein n=1 Tax=Rhizosaccharibacter radicis TaxID=2782605 RepID=A0ABT1W0M7_9PROT|nr:VacJ family lipoprotein [Acetobacteraceae bacterium KSS12]